MREIAKGVYFENSYHSGNVGFAVTREGAVLVDAPMLPKDAWDWLKKIGSATKQGIAFLINTDYQVERVLGNCFFPTATIAHQLAWGEMLRYDEAFLQRHVSHYKEREQNIAFDLTKARIVLPELTLTSDMTLYKGERVFRLIHVGGHTPASIVVHLPKEKVLFTGDVVVYGQHPSLSQANSARWLQALELIRSMEDVDIIVPGRGDLCDPSATKVLSDYITQMRERVYEYYSNGYTRRETVDRVKMQDFFDIPRGQREEIERRIRGSVERVYDEFKKEAEKKRH
jgi:glyoxylase-like metal-dependent hydrolase (beta-lactamase superfamily II)